MNGRRQDYFADARLNMKPSSAFTQLGMIARECLEPGQRGKVLATFSKAIYLLTEADELFWITTGDSPMHRRCAAISTPLPGPLAGSPFRVKDQRLTINSDTVFDLAHAATWNEPHAHCILDVSSLPARIHALFSHLDFSHTKGFGNFIPLILSLSQNNSSDSSSPSDPILHHAQPLVLDMALACLNGQPFRITQSADKLIGLGAGLTPSGDDYLGGMLFALKTLRDLYPDQFANYAIPMEPYRSRTHLISFALLNDLAHGHAIAPLHFIINSLLEGKEPENIQSAVSQLTSIGHSTGWDLLTGLLVGLKTAHRNNYFITSLQMIPSMERN